jgi:Raf kinase inhibitor-like YbhB/YbcL family protein
MNVASTAFQNQGTIPAFYTCQGRDVSPPLSWDPVPSEAKSIAIVADDPDAPDPQAPKRTWVHWVVFNLPPQTRSLPENAAAQGLPPGAKQAMNDWKKPTYGGPCPPIGRHRYFFKVYALNTMLDPAIATKSDLEKAMQGHIVGSGQIVGTYEKR